VRPDVPTGPGINITVEPDKAEAYQYMKRHEADSLILKPGEFALGETAEAIAIPPHLCGWIEGKSGRARHGLIVHCTAPHIAPGWGTAAARPLATGRVPAPKRITLELVNHGAVPLVLKAGEPIAQLILMPVSSPSGEPYHGKHLQRGT
jgi:dCTP deaminase